MIKDEMEMFDYFGKEIYKSIVEWQLEYIRSGIEKTFDSEDVFSKEERVLISKLTREEKEIFLDAIGVTMINTTSIALWEIEDGSKLAENIPKVQIDGVNMGYVGLADSFLAYVEDIEKWRKIFFCK